MARAQRFIGLASGLLGKAIHAQLVGVQGRLACIHRGARFVPEVEGGKPPGPQAGGELAQGLV